MTSFIHPLENILRFIPFGHRFPFPIEINIFWRTSPVYQVHQVWILLGFLDEGVSHQFFSTRSVLWILVQASLHKLLELLGEVAGQLGWVVFRDQEKDSHWVQIRVRWLPLQMNMSEKKLELSSRVDCEMIWNLCKFPLQMNKDEKEARAVVQRRLWDDLKPLQVLWRWYPGSRHLPWRHMPTALSPAKRTIGNFH